MIPEPWEAALLALAAFRVWKLLADDTILDVPRAWAVKRLDGKGELFLTCPWCAGWWIALAWWAAWYAWEEGTLVVAAPFALSAAVGLIASAHDKMAA